MNISYNWLKKYISLNYNIDKISKDLCSIGLLVENITKKDNDYILDVEITANRGDCLSIYGIARELSALYQKDIKIDKYDIKHDFNEDELKVTIKDKKICPRYTYRVIKNIKITASPNWLKKKLRAYGFNPINNIVDITNYIMIKTGQPLHAFDLNKIKNKSMVVTKAQKGDSMITLDGKERKLENNDIIIKDGKKIIDLSGIMGGFNSEIDKNTKNIVLQSAIFDPVYIRRTSKRLKHMTDASYRYERSVDPLNTVDSLNDAVFTIKRISPNIKIGKLNDIFNKRFMNFVKNNLIEIDFKKTKSVLGINISKEDIINYLKRLNYKHINSNKFLIPSYRYYDIKNSADLIEELARIYGLKHFKPQKISKTKSTIKSNFNKKEAIKDVIIKNGFSEIYSYSFISQETINLFNYNIDKCETLLNPQNSKEKYLRYNILSSLIATFVKNPWAPEIKIFEIGKVFQKNIEYDELCIITSQKNDTGLQNLKKLLNIQTPIKQIDKNILDKLKIRRKAYYISEKIDKITIKNIPFKTYYGRIYYQKISEYPPSIRDLAFIVDKNINSNEIQKTIRNVDKHIFIVELFDEYISDKLGKNKKNVAYHIWLQDINAPMKEEKIKKITKNIINIINKKYKARLR